MTGRIPENAEAPTLAADVRAFSDLVLSNPDQAGTWLTQADKYMQSYVQNPATFILPRANAFMKPVIEAYAYNLEGFAQYLIGIRDSFDPQSSGWEHVQALYRRVLGRYTQQLRRERSTRAIAKAEELYGVVGFHERLHWVSKLEHGWAKRRLEFLEEHRNLTQGHRIPVDVRAELLAEFWNTIDTEIYNGDVPTWS